MKGQRLEMAKQAERTPAVIGSGDYSQRTSIASHFAVATTYVYHKRPGATKDMDVSLVKE